MTGRQDDLGSALRALLLEEADAMPVDTQHAAKDLQRQLTHTRNRRRITLAVAASVVAAAVAATVAGGWLGVDKTVNPVQNTDPDKAVARGFVDAVARYDADAAISYLTSRAIAQDWGGTEQLRLDFDSYRAEGYKVTINDCMEVIRSASSVSFDCTFDLQAFRSDEIGLGPYTDNYWALIIRDGKIDSADERTGDGFNGFGDQMWIPFAEWVSSRHPDDVPVMYPVEGTPYTEERNRLWEERLVEYVADVKQDPAASLNQPEVAAYVAKLDSTCAAAQARVMNEIQAIPQQDQPAIIEARERVLGETIVELRAIPLPKAVRWAYEGRAFSLMEKFNHYEKFSGNAAPPQDKQPPESLAREIQQIPGLDQCIFPV